MFHTLPQSHPTPLTLKHELCPSPEPPPLPPPPPPPAMTLPQPHHRRRRLSTCHRHPSKPVTGFCASCLRERLAGIEPDTHKETPITRLPAELRRIKSYSAGASNFIASSSTAFVTEPRRKSCDIRARNTLSDLFHLDDRRKNGSSGKSKGLDLRLQLKEEEENVAEIRVFEEVISSNVNGTEENVKIFEEDGEFKTMKEFIDLEWEKKRDAGRDFKDIAGSVWEAASVFSKKLVKWQRRQKKRIENPHGVGGGGRGGGDLMEMERPKMRKPRETQSEIGEYGFGRRSCDTDPRLSLDVARLSVDDSRYSFDEPRASWDGYLIGKTYPRLTPMVSVTEDVKLPGEEAENVKDDVKLKNGGESSPGGTAQTRDYYTERRRRRSFDKSGLNRRVELVDDELKSISNAKVSPETVGLFHGAKLLVTEKELRDSNWYSLKGYPAERVVDSLSKDVGSGVGGDGRKGFKFMRPQRWRSLWNMWGLMPRRSESKYGDEESSVGGNAVDSPIVESLQKFSEVADREAGHVVSQKLLRSYTVSARDSCEMASGPCDIEAKENGMKRREDLVLRRNRSVKHSPNNHDNGLLRFYLTPMRSYGRSKSGKSRLMNCSATRNVL